MPITRWLQDNRGLLVFLLLLGVFRGAVADWNPIPSGSMHPNLLEGDVVLVNRLAYDLKLPLTDVSVARMGEPRRGDVVTFNSPKDGTRLIKRVIGLPGDVVAMEGEVLRINGAAAHYTPAETSAALPDGNLQALESLPGHSHAIVLQPRLPALRDFPPLTVPADSYLVLGDNRDNSADSRYIGFVPRRLLIGRAHHILVSADMLGNWAPRFARFGKAL